MAWFAAQDLTHEICVCRCVYTAWVPVLRWMNNPLLSSHLIWILLCIQGRLPSSCLDIQGMNGPIPDSEHVLSIQGKALRVRNVILLPHKCTNHSLWQLLFVMWKRHLTGTLYFPISILPAYNLFVFPLLLLPFLSIVLSPLSPLSPLLRLFYLRSIVQECRQRLHRSTSPWRPEKGRIFQRSLASGKELTG